MLLLRGRLSLQLLDRRLQLGNSPGKEFFIDIELKYRQLKFEKGIAPVAELHQLAMRYATLTVAYCFDLPCLYSPSDSLLGTTAQESSFAYLPEAGVALEEGKHSLYLSHSITSRSGHGA